MLLLNQHKESPTTLDSARRRGSLGAMGPCQLQGALPGHRLTDKLGHRSGNVMPHSLHTSLSVAKELAFIHRLMNKVLG